MEAGAGAPSGVVEGSKADGRELEIESNGKPVHKNSDAANPAVHVARQPGNDVVKRASKLTKRQSAAESPEAEEGGGGKNGAAVQGEKGGEEKEGGGKGGGKEGKEKGGKKGGKEKGGKTDKQSKPDKSTGQQSAGTKRDRVEPEQAQAHEEHEQAAKKPKLDEVAENSNPAESTAAPKRKVGRPKKSATTATAKKEVVFNQDTPAARTRSRS